MPKNKCPKNEKEHHNIIVLLMINDLTRNESGKISQIPNFLYSHNHTLRNEFCMCKDGKVDKIATDG